MAEKLNRYYQIYNNKEDYYCQPLTEKQLLTEIEIGLIITPLNGKIIFDISPVMLTEKQFIDKDYYTDN